MKRLFSLLLLLLWQNTPAQLSRSAVPAPSLELSLEQQNEYKKALQLMIQLLSQHHYQQYNLKQIGQDVFDDYIHNLDSNHLYFLQSDLEALAPLRSEINNLRRHDLSAAFEIHRLYRQRAEALARWSMKRLEHPFNLDSEATVFYPRAATAAERKKLPYFKDLDEVHRQQEKRLADQIIRLMLNGKGEAEARQKVRERYESSLKSLQQFTAQDVFDIYMNSISGRFDPHTAYLSPRNSEDFDITMRLSLEGIGAVLSRQDDKISIRELIAGGPAAKSGQLKIKDQILGVAQGENGEMVDVVGWRLDKAVDLIRGKKGSTVRLLVESQSDIREISLVRDEIKLEEQAATYTIEELDGKRFGLIDLPSFYMDFDGASQGKAEYRSTSRDLRRILQQLKEEQVDGVLLDLRSNGGGSLVEAIASVGLFIDQGAVVMVHDQESRKIESDEEPGAVYEGPLAVLIGEHSASASEIFAAAIQDYHRGIIIGNNSYGKGTVQTLTRLNRFTQNERDLGSVKFTTAMFYRVNGDSTQLQGVQPDVILPSSEDLNEVGEVAQAYALPWQRIPAAKIQALRAVDATTIEHLNRARAQRLQSVPAFRRHEERLARERALQRQELWSLNWAQRQREHQQLKDERKQYEALQREALPELRRDERTKKKLAEHNLFIDEQSGEEKEDFVPDLVLHEALHVLADFVAIPSASF